MAPRRRILAKFGEIFLLFLRFASTGCQYLANYCIHKTCHEFYSLYEALAINLPTFCFISVRESDNFVLSGPLREPVGRVRSFGERGFRFETRVESAFAKFRLIFNSVIRRIGSVDRRLDRGSSPNLARSSSYLRVSLRYGSMICSNCFCQKIFAKISEEYL